MGLDIAADRRERQQKQRAKEQGSAVDAAIIKGFNAFVKIGSGGNYICTQCGTKGAPVTITRGSFLVEVALWLCFLIPGIIYSLWRLSSKAKGCPLCKTPTMIKTDTPVGKDLVERYCSDVS